MVGFALGSREPKPDFLIALEDELALARTQKGFCGFPELTEFMANDHNIFVPGHFSVQLNKKAKITALSGFIKTWERTCWFYIWY